MNPRCQRCKKDHVPGTPQWKCCSKHTTGFGSDWVCDDCAVKLHPEKAGIVTHAMFNEHGILPCCELSRYEVRQTDRVAVLNDDVVTCTGKKRYQEKT